jgi:K+-sensing histidine kinase KdpD
VEKENGSGLGLYICKKLMHLMEGEITGRIIECESGNKMQVNVLFRM